MHYIIQDGFFHETGMDDLLSILEKAEIPHTVVKVVPFVGEIIPDIDPKGCVICFGSYSMRHTAKKKGWFPGVFDLEKQSEYIYFYPNWKDHILNKDAVFVPFIKTADIAENRGWNEFFLRPVNDSKCFAGGVFTKEELKEWIHKVVDLREDDGSSLTGNTSCIICEPKVIYTEYRTFIIDHEYVTGSQYKVGGRVKYDQNVDEDVIKFANDRASEYHIDNAYVMDIARTPDGLKIVELNTMNSAGFYQSNVGKIVDKLEELYGE